MDVAAHANAAPAIDDAELRSALLVAFEQVRFAHTQHRLLGFRPFTRAAPASSLPATHTSAVKHAVRKSVRKTVSHARLGRRAVRRGANRRCRRRCARTSTRSPRRRCLSSRAS
eukprot:2101178-Pleurochrysis_carterae.AAC.1